MMSEKEFWDRFRKISDTAGVFNNSDDTVQRVCAAEDVLVRGMSCYEAGANSPVVISHQAVAAAVQAILAVEL